MISNYSVCVPSHDIWYAGAGAVPNLQVQALSLNLVPVGIPGH